MKERIKKIFSSSNADAFIIVNGSHPSLDPNFFYASGILSGVFEHSMIIAQKAGKATLLTSRLEEDIARKETSLDVQVFESKETKEAAIRSLLSGTKAVGLSGSFISYRDFNRLSKIINVKMKDMTAAFAHARSIKDPREIKSITAACRISAKAAEEFPGYLKEGVTEREMAAKLAELQYAFGATSIAFPPIVAFGENASRPHHTASLRKLKKNEFVLIDFGAEYMRYASDLSRTFVFGRASETMKSMYMAVKEAQDAAMDIIREGKNGRDADREARRIIDRNFKGKFIHSLGHEVGLEIHDGGVLGPNGSFPLKKNMVVTNEPGVYIPQIGGVRIEDTVLVGKGRPKILTASSTDLQEI
ncbi:MAG: aminopeptidase P family protein [Candidatus Aenigmarchaeota archaeon]|nr:aminopeptidase P family protein [Candidatus Aenigmarchaeota archaeon]